MRSLFATIFFTFTILNHAQTAFEIQKLEDFSKLYGIVRYFHPSDQANEIEWEIFVQYGVDKVLKSKDKEEFSNVLKELFSPIAPTISFNDFYYQWDTVDIYPVFWKHNGLGLGSLEKSYKSIRVNKDLDEFADPISFDSLNIDKYYKLQILDHSWINIPTVVYAKDGYTLPLIDSIKLSLFKQKIEYKNSIKYPNTAITNIIIIWNTLRHFYPYQQEVKLNWDNILRKGLEEAFNNRTALDHLLTLRMFTETFKDGHMAISNYRFRKSKAYVPSFSWKIIDNELVISKVLKEDSGLKLGDIIKNVNGQDYINYIDSISQYISGSKQWKEWQALQLGLRGKQGSDIVLHLKDGREINITRDQSYNKQRKIYNREDTIKYKSLSPDIFYIDLNNLSAQELDLIIPTINKHTGLIIDLRGYPKDTRHRILSYTDVVDSTAWMCRNTILAPNFSISTESCKGYPLNNNKSDTKLRTKNILLVDERSISNAETLAQVMKHYGVAIIMGKPTAGANGNINRIKLLDNFYFSFTGLKVINPDGTQFHNIGVIPDVHVKETINNIFEGKDTLIEKAVDLLNNYEKY